MRSKSAIGIILISIALLSTLAPLASAESLSKDDFEQESFAKTVDYFDYARAYAKLNGIETAPGFQNWHANMYMTYVNTSGLKLLYAGLENITFGNEGYLRIPMQSFIMHYRTGEEKHDVITASTFLMLMAFNETANSNIDDSPDANDVLYASFSMGFDLSAFGAVRPILNSKTETIPLTHSDDKLTWSWGMKYTNLTALWWRTWIDPTNPHFDNTLPLALTTYDELTFMYTLRIDPNSGTATLQENHIIGRMRDLIVGVLPILWVYYNSTGMYGPLGRKLSDETVYDYIYKNNLKMSIVNFQTSIMAEHETYSETSNDQIPSETEDLISDASIDTFADDGSKIFNADFGAKKSYLLYNYTEDPTEKTFETFDSTARNASIAGFAGNVGLFAYHIGLMKFLPLVVVHMYPGLFAKAASTLSSMTKANYFYIIAYPEYSGFRIEHDPVFTAYLATSTDSTENTQEAKWVGIFIVIVAVAAIAIILVMLLSSRRKRRP